jgi:hypothetical protein
MSSEFRNATTAGYRFREESPNGPCPIDPPESGGGLAGDPVKSDYVYPPASVDPREPEPDPTQPSQG